MSNTSVPLNLPITQTVYGYPSATVESLVKKMWQDETEALLDMYRDPWTKKQDTLHLSTMSVWKSWASHLVEGIEAFEFNYPTAGASEGIRI